LGRDQAQESEASGIREYPQGVRQALGIRPPQRGGQKAVGTAALQHLEHLHDPVILTGIDASVKISTTIDMRR
jgi:hypothetical protein